MRKLFFMLLKTILVCPLLIKAQWYPVCGYPCNYPNHYLDYANFVDAVFTTEHDTYNCYRSGVYPHDYYAGLDYSSNTGGTFNTIFSDVSYNVSLAPTAVYSCKNQVVLYYLELLGGTNTTIKRKVGNGAFYNVGSLPMVIDFYAKNSFYYYALSINNNYTYLAKYRAAYPFNWQFAQWSPSDYRPKTLCFPDSTIGYLAAADSLNQKCYQIFKSVNAGSNWSMIYSNNNANIRKLFFTDSIHGYAIGDSGLVIKTIDGGTTWSDVNIFKPRNLRSICFFNDTVGYVGGDSALIFKTTNGGNSWTQETQAYNASVKKIYCVNDSTGFALIGEIMYSNNINLAEGMESLNTGKPFFVIYPNPNKGTFNIKIPDEVTDLSGAMLVVNDNIGKEITRYGLGAVNNKSNPQFDITFLAQGVYIMKLITKEKKTYIGKLVVE